MKIDTDYDLIDSEIDIEILPPIGTLIFLNEFFDAKYLDDYFKDTDENYEDPFRLRRYLLLKDEKGYYYNLIFELE